MWFIILVAVAHITLTIVLANYLDLQRQPTIKQPTGLSYPYLTQPAPPPPDEEAPPGLQLLLFLMLAVIAVLVALNGVSALLSVVLPPEMLADDQLLGLTLTQGLIVGAIGSGAALLAFAVLLSDRFRELLSRWPFVNGFNPNAYVHRTALVLALVVLADTFMNVILAGGVEGLADQLDESSIGAFEIVANLVLMVFLALLGAGLFVRRTWGHVMERLALRLPTGSDWLYGLGAAFISLIAMFTFLGLLSLVVPSEVLNEQGAASDEIARALGDSIPMAFLSAMSAAVGEEILFRGALQPIFGIIPTTLFFALLHSQYALTPGSLAIVIVGLIFAWLKERQGTTSAIIAHFAYNFTLLLLAYVVIQAEQAGLIPEMFIYLLGR